MKRLQLNVPSGRRAVEHKTTCTPVSMEQDDGKFILKGYILAKFYTHVGRVAAQVGCAELLLESGGLIAVYVAIRCGGVLPMRTTV